MNALHAEITLVGRIDDGAFLPFGAFMEAAR